MRRSGTIENYSWVEDEAACLEELLFELLPYLLGSRAINTSFDSGILGSRKFKLTKEDLEYGWSVVNGRAVSPIITRDNLKNFLYTDSYDEWYFFNKIPKNFEATAFCNFGGLSFQRPAEIAFKSGPDTISNLGKYQPIAVAGWNDAFSYYITNEPVHA